ncbi:hypothetical protein [Chitinimonas sp.]|uniref:CIS tube protein n=1 Tax=Chitinimonas sp. TaxID=1934313 RepID=UPI002F94577A
MASLSGEKTPLKMTICSETQGVVAPMEGDANSVSLLINPSSLKVQRTTCFTKQIPLGDPATGRKYSHMQPVTLSFTAIFDGTGVVPRPTGTRIPLEVEDQLAALSRIIYNFDGKKHQPNIVQIVWGSLIFTGRLNSFGTDYTLFRPSGAPLRASCAFAFTSFMTTKESRLEADTSSPDLSHLVVVKAGDTLPLLCHRIYGDSRYYAEVARFNGLRQFRSLEPGSALHFPPLD